jgi:hypothetical protein
MSQLLKTNKTTKTDISIEVDLPAKTSASLANAQELQAVAQDSGLRCSASSRKQSPDLSFGKTSKALSTQVDLPKFCTDSANWAIASMWKSYRQRQSEHPTYANESLWLPTPVAYADKHRPGQTKLDRRLRLLPTPTASQGFGLVKELKPYLPPGEVLNPQFVEWLMGFPEDWTDLPRSATQLSLP